MTTATGTAHVSKTSIHSGHRGPRRLQHLLSRAVWDDQHLVNMITTAAVLFARLTAAEQEADPQNRDGNLPPQRERYQPP